jgi:hypothetical protein
MDDLTYWTEQLRQAEAELEAARRRTEVDEAARKFQRAKAELKALKELAKAPKRRTDRGSKSGNA